MLSTESCDILELGYKIRKYHNLESINYVVVSTFLRKLVLTARGGTKDDTQQEVEETPTESPPTMDSVMSNSGANYSPH